MSLQDGVNEMVESFVLILPFLVALRVLDRREHLDEIFRALALSAAVYSLLVLFELRMSPQLHNMVYGYFPHSWIQHLRGGGYRPLVFMSHGLVLGFFLLTATLAAFALYRRGRDGRWLVVGLWLLAILFMSRNTGAAMLAVILVPMMLLAPARAQIGLAAFTAVIFLLYPAFHQSMSAGFATLVQSVPGVDPARVDSLVFRLENEAILLDRAQERPLFGWGGHGRNRVFLDNGRDISITDGDWIVRLGKYGWLGFLSQYGIVVLGLLAVWRRRADLTPGPETGFALILVAFLAYNIPNAIWPLYVLIGLGAVINAAASKDARAPVAATPSSRRQSPYTRFSGDAPEGSAAREASAPAEQRETRPPRARLRRSRQG